MFQKFLTIVIVSFFVLILKPNTHFGQSSTPKIIFGNYGGFTGMKNSFVFFKDGRLLKGSGNALSDIEITKIKQCKTKRIFRKAKKAAKLLINETGNVNYFIDYNDDTEDKKNIWTNHQQQKKLYKIYLSLVKLTLVKQSSSNTKK